MPPPGLPHQDLIGKPYRPQGRDPVTGLDCLGVVLEIYRRAGYRVPDPRPGEGGLPTYLHLWEEVPEPDEDLDVLWGRWSGQNALWTVADAAAGWAITAQQRSGCVFQRVPAVIQAVDGVRIYRLKPGSVPTE